MIVTLSILSVVIVIFAYTTFNLLRKSEKLESIVDKQQEFIKQFKKLVDYSDGKITEIDSNGMFSSDDEIGWFFTNLKELQKIMSDYVNKK